MKKKEVCSDEMNIVIRSMVQSGKNAMLDDDDHGREARERTLYRGDYILVCLVLCCWEFCWSCAPLLLLSSTQLSGDYMMTTGMVHNTRFLLSTLIQSKNS